MKPIQKEELFGNLSSFLKTKGVELKEGSYSQAVEKSCGILADVINLTQHGVERAKDEIDKRVDQMRQVIHEKTAPSPKPAPTETPSPKPEPAAPAPAAATPPQSETARSEAHKPRKPQPRKAVRKPK